MSSHAVTDKLPPRRSRASRLRQQSPRLSQARAPWLFMAPSLIVLAIFVVYPMVRAAYLSFTKYGLLKPPVWVGLENYQRLLHDPQATNALANTLVYAAATTVVSIALAFVLAVLLNVKFFGRGFARTAIFVPYIISMGVIAISWTFLLNPDIGLLSYWLQSVGIDAGQGWLRNPNLAPVTVIAVGVWKNLGFYVVIFLAGMQSIPQEINESASVEGAGPIRRHVVITWPLLSNQVMLVAIVATITNVQVFDQIYVMTQGGPFFRTESIVTLIYRTGFTELDFGYASALSFVLLLLLLVLSLAQLAYFRGKAVSY